MATPIKTTFIFGGFLRGWTESYSYEESSSQPDLSRALTKSVALAGARAGLMASGVTLDAVRVSLDYVNHDENPRNTLLSYTNLQGRGEWDAADPAIALQVRCYQEASGRAKLIFMRGIPDALEVNGGKFTPVLNNWATSWLNWRNKFVRDGWGWKSSLRKFTTFITSYGSIGSVYQTQFVLAVDPWVNGVPRVRQQVRVSGLNGKSAWNGLLLVDPDMTLPRIIQNVKPAVHGPYQSVGKVIFYGSQINSTDQMDPQKIVVRRPGAPLLQSRGRRSVRAKS